MLQALLEARYNTDKWPGVFASTAGMIFFGTPFRGAEGMSQSEMLEAALTEYEPDQVQEEVLRILEPGNEFLQDLVGKFGETRSQANKAPAACFFELKSSNVGAIVGGRARTVCRILSASIHAFKLTVGAEIRRQRKLRLPRPFRLDGEVLSRADSFQHEQVWQAYRGRLSDSVRCHRKDGQDSA